MGEKKGTIIPNNAYLHEHEYATILYLTECGYDVEVILPSSEKGEKSPDIMMNGLIWEMKSPVGKGKWVIKNIMQKASHQSENVIMDLRRLKHFPQGKYIKEVEYRFETISRLKKLIIISKEQKIIEIEKKD